MNRKFSDARYLTLLSLFVAIELVVGLVPYLGYIPLNPLLNVTIIHIPVIIGAIILGAKAGGILGFVFGLTSLINATFLRPSPVESPLFSPFFSGGVFQGNFNSLLICFVPRILVGIVAAYVFIGLKRTRLPNGINLLITGIIGSLVNTILVLSGIYIFFAKPFAAANMLSGTRALFNVLMGIFSFNGLIEAAIAGVLTMAIAGALLMYQRRMRNYQ